MKRMFCMSLDRAEIALSMLFLDLATWDAACSLIIGLNCEHGSNFMYSPVYYVGNGLYTQSPKYTRPMARSAFLTAFVSAALDYVDSILEKQRYYGGIVTNLGPRAVPCQLVVRVFEQYVEGVMEANQEKGQDDKEHFSHSLIHGIMAFHIRI